ncbi:MAG: hypothetical protein GWN84_00615 [Gammaproteobacteria bacterium]|nr:hypothetical protein [Gammaproteobacteria bacterium]NIR88352.1 hypothetical protein [Gammaproteobacteria bacterium]NIU02802.1 hypothetical protein [Gammaproteobacteria bacterium]NIV50326.1 hypothetical protein [Gammaproteobacteria bacterium]NIW87047.1 hypothetical protein [Gammaproteobacteria bacterium]
MYELLVATPGLRAAIEQGASTEALYRIAVEGEMVPLTRNALTQARRRCTSLAEVYRVRLD